MVVGSTTSIESATTRESPDDDPSQFRYRGFSLSWVRQISSWGFRMSDLGTHRTACFLRASFYARRLDTETVELIGVDFDWSYWDLIATDPKG